MKEYILTVMHENKGLFIESLKINDVLGVDITACDALLKSKFIEVQKDSDFSEKALEHAKETAKRIGRKEETFIPVIIECNYTVKTLDGKEIDRDELLKNCVENMSPLDILNSLVNRVN
jgi:hypothetical protein